MALIKPDAAFFILAICLFIPALLIQAEPRQDRAETQNVAGGQPQIEHFPVTFGVEGKPIVIEAGVVAPGRQVIYLRIYFKSPNQQAFRNLDMRPGPQGYIGQIPGFVVRPPAVHYFLVALLSDHTVINYPSKNPYGQPFEVLVQENAEKRIESERAPKSGAGEKVKPETPPQPVSEPPLEVSPQLLDKIQRLERPTAKANSPADTSARLAVLPEAPVNTPPPEESPSPILVLSPDPFSSVAAGEVVIAASFITETAIDSSSVQVLLDGNEVTSKAEVSANMISYSPAQIAPGEHTATITARDEFDQAIGPLSWRFHVTGKANATADAVVAEKKPEIRATGNVYAEMRREQFGGRSLNNNNIGADLNGNTGPLRYSVSAYFTSLEDKAFQPRNRFVLNAGFSWLNFTLGDATPYFDELVLWGRRVRGFQAGLHTGMINFDFVSGETVRQVDPIYALVPDTLNPGNTQKIRQRFGTYRQTLLGLRPSFGSRNGFQWGFTLLKVRDDTTSLPVDSSDVTQIGRVTPRDNLVVGTDLTLAFDRRRFEIKASAAYSLMSNDISKGPISPDSLKKISDIDLPFDPQDFAKWFILNESTSPLDPRGKTSLAYQLSLQFNYFNQFVTAGYKQLGSEYVSLGQSFLRNDIRGFFINDRWRMLRNRVYLTLGFESYDDHFNTIDGRPATNLKTWQWGVSIYWDPRLPSLSLNLRNHNRNNGIDTLQVSNFGANVDRREDNATRDVSLSLNYEANAFNLDHTLTFSLMSSDRSDNIIRSANIASGDVASNLKMLSLRTRFQMPITSTLTYAVNDNDIAGGQSLFKYKMFSGRVDYDFSQKRTENQRLQIRAYGGFSTTSASGGTTANSTIPSSVINVIDYHQTGFQFGGAAQYGAHHEFVLDLNLVNYQDHGGVRTSVGNTPVFNPNPSFKNSIIRAYYTFRF